MFETQSYMCLSPVTIPNQSKYISLSHADSFLFQVPCGECAECQQTLSNQWYYRAWYEFNDLESTGGYVLFDTLTYRDSDLPHLSDVWSDLPKNLDYPCFNNLHIRRFLQLLRTRLIRAGYCKQSFRYFLSSEYGTHDSYMRNGRLVKATHRPHYHLLLYVTDSRIDPIWLSNLVADIWRFGRTDGAPYKGASYVLGKNVIRAATAGASKLRTCHYVTKYVQKSCIFQEQLRKRIAVVMYELAKFADPVSPDTWLDSEIARRERLKLLRYVNQFHRQSQHFGESAIGDIDLNQLFADGCLYMPDTKGVKIPVPLPMYYKRKMMFDLVEFNGSRYWVLNDLGKEYKQARKDEIFKRLVERYDCVIRQYNLDCNSSVLADYVFNRRGRIVADKPESTLIDRIDDIDYINYSNCSDKLQFGCRGLTEYWLGDSQQGYKSTKMHGRVPLSDFITKYVYFDSVLEKQLELVFDKMRNRNKSKQDVFKLKQELTQKYKLFSNCVSCK